MRASKTVVWILLLTLIGCQKFNLRLQSPEEGDEDEVQHELETSVHTPLIGDYTRPNIGGLHMIALHGVGLVVGLDGTGGDPPVSAHRTMLLDQLRKQKVPNPNQLLRSPDTALVLIKAYLPPLIKTGERFDVEVYLPANSRAASLSGGRLWKTELTEQAFVEGRGLLKGFTFATAEGPILVSTGEGDQDSLAGVLQRGRILGGGQSKKERHLQLHLRDDFGNFRNAQRIASRIAGRFHSYDEFGLQEAMAEAKTTHNIELKLHERYKDNFPRYLNVIRSIAFRETPVAARVRMQKLKNLLHNPPTSEQAALQLEAIGNDAIPILKTGLKNDSLEVRFHSAVALGYLGQADGLPALKEAVAEPAFRVFAFAAMSVIDEVESHFILRDLMSEQSIETRYGAFRALWVLDKNDDFIRGEPLSEGEFMLHVLHTDGSPLIHLTHHQHAEIVLFGAEQRFQPPIAIRAGKYILITGREGSSTVTISRYQTDESGRIIGWKEEVPSRVADVIRMLAEFGATYPDIAQMLVQADKQHNLPGPVAIDALPQAGRVYRRPANPQGEIAETETRVGHSQQIPNLFSELKEDKPDEDMDDDTSRTPDDPSGDADRPAGGNDSETSQKGDQAGTASLVDISASDDGNATSQQRKQNADKNRRTKTTKKSSSFLDIFK